MLFLFFPTFICVCVCVCAQNVDNNSTYVVRILCGLNETIHEKLSLMSAHNLLSKSPV